ncbi:MAG TPA: FeoA family protein [Marmoricola sp.]|nr:FeoA family protein [Marmoricola sp.]
MTRYTLADLAIGQAATIVEVCGEDIGTSRRLLDLGLTPGAQVQLIRRAPLLDPIICRVAGYELALRRVQARCVRVDALS